MSMNLAVVGLLAGLLLAGFARPRWWLSLLPVAVTVGLAIYRLSLRSSSEDAVAFLGIVLLTVAMEGALVGGALSRAGFELSRSRPVRVRQALGAARAVALAGVAFAGGAVVVSRAATGLAMLFGVAAAAIVLAKAWHARLRRRPRRPPGRAVTVAPARSTPPRGTERRAQRRAATPREVARVQRRRIRA